MSNADGEARSERGPRYDPELTSADLAPTPPEARTWTAFHMGALWVGMVVCVPTYMLAGGLVELGMNWRQAVVTVALGNLIVLVPMLLNGHPGARYGIPFPVLARASFGVRGANLPSLLRGLVACGWFGIQTWIGGSALAQIVYRLLGREPGSRDIGGLGIEPIELACFLLFWAVQVWILWRGMESLKRFESWAAPCLVVAGLLLFGWALARSGGLQPMLAASSRSTLQGREFLRVFFPSLTAMVGFWATLSLNIPDFTRFARSQRAQVVGQTVALPLAMTLFAFIGVAVTSGTVLIFGEPVPDPVALIGRLESGPAVVLSLLGIALATLSTNLAANVVSPANAVVHAAPRRFRFRTAALLSAGLGAIVLPWKLIESTSGYIFTWLVGYSALLGPIGGILIVDYYLIRRRRLDVEGLYRLDGPYGYRRGYHPAALVALIVGVLPNVPGFLAAAGALPEVPSPLATLYTYAWFVGFGVAGLVYWLLAGRRTLRS